MLLKRNFGIITLLLIAGLNTDLPSRAAIFEDHFTTLKPDYVVDKTTTSVKDGTLQMKFKGSLSQMALQTTLLFNDMDASVATVVLEAAGATPETQPTTGLIFWANDSGNFYELKLGVNGLATVSRLVANARWTHPLPWAQATKFNAGLGKYNTLRVVTKGTHATCYVNNEKVGEFEGQIPAGGSQIGVECEAPGPFEMTAAFKDLTIKY